jgi:hypothetical protein
MKRRGEHCERRASTRRKKNGAQVGIQRPFYFYFRFNGGTHNFPTLLMAYINAHNFPTFLTSNGLHPIA